MRKFSEVLEEYLEERDNLNRDYEDQPGSKFKSRYRMRDLAEELDEMVQGVEE